MVLLVHPSERRKIVGASILLILFSTFPLIYMMNESYEFFITFIKLTLLPVFFINIFALFINRASFCFFSLTATFFYFSFSYLAGFFLAAKLYFGFKIFFILIFFYFLLFTYDNYLLYKNRYFYKYKEIFNKNIINGYYLFNNIREFEELKKYRLNTKIPKFQILYLISLPFLFIFKGMIFKVSSQDSNLSSSLGTSIILSFAFIYVFAAFMIFFQDFTIRYYLSIKHKS